ncbi:MAG: phospholipase D-like domain-containing protein [Verrucomicrobiota bacterium]
MSKDQEPKSAESKPRRGPRLLQRLLLGLVGLYLALWIAGALLTSGRPPMNGTDLYTPATPVARDNINLLFDRTSWTDEGELVSEQEIFPAMLAMIEEAEGAIILDMFLVNQFGAKAENGLDHRDTTRELIDALVAKLAADPDTWILFVTDPINSTYGDECPKPLRPLVEAGGHVVLTNLHALEDSNPLYSLPYRALRPLLRRVPFLHKPIFDHPFDGGEDPVATMQLLDMLNFKANHRKVLTSRTADGQWHALVASANPHTASSRHDNIAVQLHAGPLQAIRNSELRIAADSIRPRPELLFSSATTTQVLEQINSWLEKPSSPPVDDAERRPGAMTARYCSEGALGETVDELLRKASRGDTVELLMFYLADPRVVRGLRKAAERGATLRILLDPNQDAFGRRKRGIPNRVIATRLHDWAAARDDVDLTIRWANTRGEQMHAKALRIVLESAGTEHYLLGSANFTTRNLRGTNLESGVLIENGAALANQWQENFNAMWQNPGGTKASLPFDRYASRGFKGFIDRILTFLTNTTGFSTY